MFWVCGVVWLTGWFVLLLFMCVWMDWMGWDGMHICICIDATGHCGEIYVSMVEFFMGMSLKNPFAVKR